jgi:polyisoprenoid-binding protein YceI
VLSLIVHSGGYMQKFLYGMLALLLSFSFSAAAAESYHFDTNHTHILWHINHFGYSNPAGLWFAEGHLTLDEKNPENSRVEIQVKMKDLVTGIPALDEHLKGKDFLDVAHFPNANFKSTKVVVTRKDAAEVSGILTLHGISKPITLNMILNKNDISPISKKKTAGFSGTAKIKRSEFGITLYLPGLSDEVTLDIQAEANLA